MSSAAQEVFGDRLARPPERDAVIGHWLRIRSRGT